ncbi:MAG: esterase-like activity of phytase family protein [Verrucomicrobia bacterium]|nr:esterase-like activity of phytase family protein [Verrucomicrobiota bacterium]
MRQGRLLALMLAACGVAHVVAGQTPPRPASPAKADAVESSASQPEYFTLRAEQWWLLNLPNDQRFDASGLVLLPDGGLLTVNDRAPGLWRIEFLKGTNAADLLHLREAFTADQLAPFSGEKIHRYDCEGIARDEQGRLYVCEEANRWILRFDPKTETVERLNIDWSAVAKYFHPTDLNASFEGVAIGNGKLYVANERQQGVIIVVDLATLKVVDDFIVKPPGSRARDAHYSDLRWSDGELWVLCRDHRRSSSASGRMCANSPHFALFTCVPFVSSPRRL